MRRAVLLLLLVSCDGGDTLGNLSVVIDGQEETANTCVISIFAASHRPHGLYLFAELPAGQLEFDVDESGAVDAQHVIWRELDGTTETFRSQAVTGQVTLLGPPKQRRGELDLTFASGGETRHITGRFWPREAATAPSDSTPPADDGTDYGQAVDTGCDTSTSADDSSGCDGSSSEADTSSGCDGSSAGDSGAGCSGDPGGGGCGSEAHAARVAPHLVVRRPTPVRIVLWALPYALVGVVVQIWRRRLRCRR